MSGKYKRITGGSQPLKQKVWGLSFNPRRSSYLNTGLRSGRRVSGLFDAPPDRYSLKCQGDRGNFTSPAWNTSMNALTVASARAPPSLAVIVVALTSATAAR
jgi:hypothetical protein